MRLVRRQPPPPSRWGKLLFDAAVSVGEPAADGAMPRAFPALPTGLDDMIMKAVVNVESHEARVRASRAQFSAVRERAVLSASSLTPAEPVAPQQVALHHPPLPHQSAGAPHRLDRSY